MAENSTQQERPATEQAPNQGQATNGQANNQGQPQAPGNDGQQPQQSQPQQSQPQQGQQQQGQQQQGQPEEPKKKKKPTLYIVAAVLFVLAVIFGGRAYVFNLSHVSTDDAYITGNSVNVSALISGTLNKLTVQEGDAVKNGQLIGRIEASGQEASLRAAQAAYQSAQTEIPQAQTTLKYQEQASQAALQKAEAANAAQAARTRGAGDQLALTRRTTASTIAQANAQVTQAKAQAAQVAASGLTAAAQVRVAQQAVTTAQKGVDQLSAKVLAAQAEVKRTQADLQRYSKLLAQEAVTQQNYDSVASQAATAQSNLDSLEQQISQARSQVISAQQTVSQNQANYAAALQSAQAANEQIKVAQAGLSIAKANQFQVGVQNSNVQTSAATNGSSQADIQTAKAGLTQVDVQRQHIATVQAEAQQAKAAVDNAKVEFNDTYIYCPTDGQVVRKSVNVGASLSPGQTIVTITQGHQTWVTANFKETQLTDVRVGQPAEIEVDSFPGVVFRAVVASVNDATGATTSLLPPDNSTGNFTKVVQRIPVRLAFVQGEAKGDATADDLKLLRQGMSVTATIDTADKNPHPDRVPKDYNRPVDERTSFRSDSDVENPSSPASISGLSMDRPNDRKRYGKALVG